MTEFEKLKQRIRALSSVDFATLREWFLELDESIWDQQIEADAKSGKLDAFFADARREIDAGTCPRSMIDARRGTQWPIK